MDTMTPRPAGRKGRRPSRASRAPFFSLKGDRTASHRHLADLCELGLVLAWSRPGAEPIVVLSARLFAGLTGRAIATGTFSASRWCARCARFRPSGRPCQHCNPPASKAVRGAARVR